MDIEKVEFETDFLIPGLNETQKNALCEAIKNSYNK